MAGLRKLSVLSSPLLGAALFCWTLVGETSHPLLSVRDLPRDILSGCDLSICAAQDEFRSDWIGRTEEGDLFVVSRAVCTPDDCPHWLVQRGRVSVRTLLEMRGSFRLHRTSGYYPNVELRTRSADDDDVLRVRFEWNGNEYARTSMQRVYEVNGVECGTRLECHYVAERAFKAQQTDRALRIWQKVHGVSWI
jgi:hypothetical protein